MNYKVGQRVKATRQITEGGHGVPGNPDAKDLDDKGWIHAEKDEEGFVEYVDDKTRPTVRFDRTGTSTVVGASEIEAVEDRDG